MYAPNTVGFPPSRSSLTHWIQNEGSCSEVRITRLSTRNNPFAVKRFSGSGSSLLSAKPSGNRITESKITNRTGLYSSVGVGGQSIWDKSNGQKRPVLREDGENVYCHSNNSSQVVASQTVHSNQNASRIKIEPDANHPDKSDTTSGDNASASSSSSFVLRPPKLPGLFSTFEGSHENLNQIREDNNLISSEQQQNQSVSGELPETKIAISEVSNEKGRSNQVHPNTEKCSNFVFVPLGRSESASDNGNFSSNSAVASVNSRTLRKSSLKRIVGGPTSTSTSTSEGFVFGNNILQRVSNRLSAKKTIKCQEDMPEKKPSASQSTSDNVSFGELKNQKRTVKNCSSTTLPRRRKRSLNSGELPDESVSCFTTNLQDNKQCKFVDTPVITGEEDEFNVIQIMCRLFVFDSLTSKWLERGRGQLRLNDRTEVNNDLKSRLIVRTNGSLRLMLNTNVWAGMTFDRASNKSVRFTANDNGNLKIFIVTTAVGDADQLYKALAWRVQALKSIEDKKACGLDSVDGCGTGLIDDSTASRRMARRMSDSHHLILHSVQSRKCRKSVATNNGYTTFYSGERTSTKTIGDASECLINVPSIKKKLLMFSAVDSRGEVKDKDMPDCGNY